MEITMKRTHTGIKGLDNLIEGGIPEGWVVLLTGPTGTGKTIFAVQYLYNGYIDYNEPGVYISLEEDVQDILKVMSSFGWDLNSLQKEKKLVMINAIPKKSPDATEYVIKAPLFSRTYSFESICTLLEEKITEINAKRVVIDGLSALTLLYNDDFKIRQGLLDMTNIIRSSGCTTIYTTEVPEGSLGISRFGKTHLRQFPLGCQIQREIVLFFKTEFSGNKAGGKGFGMCVQSTHVTVILISGLLDIFLDLIQTFLQVKKICTGFKIRICFSKSQKSTQ